jgi:hypothetical protein
LPWMRRPSRFMSICFWLQWSPNARIARVHLSAR